MGSQLAPGPLNSPDRQRPVIAILFRVRDKNRELKNFLEFQVLGKNISPVTFILQDLLYFFLGFRFDPAALMQHPVNSSDRDLSLFGNIFYSNNVKPSTLNFQDKYLSDSGLKYNIFGNFLLNLNTPGLFSAGHTPARFHKEYGGRTYQETS